MRPSPVTRTDRTARLVGTVFLLAAGWAVLTSEVSADYKNAVSLYKRQKFREAIKEIQPDISRYPDWEFGHRLVGLCYFGLKEYASAIRAFEKAVELKSTEPSVFLGLAESYLQTGRINEALSALEKGQSHCTRQRDLYDLHRLFANIRYRKGDLAGCTESMLEAFQHQPGTARDWLLLGICYYRTDQVMKARQALSTAQKFDPALTMAQDYLNRLQIKEGELALKSRNYTMAKSTFESYLQQNPGDRAAQLNLAMAEVGLKNWAGAENILRSIEADFTDSYRYFFYRGYVLENLERYQEAEPFYRRAAKLEGTKEALDALERLQRRLKKQ